MDAIAEILPAAPLHVHCMEPWAIARSQPSAEHLAKRWLERAGFECWYPQARHVKSIPQRHISSKTRHRRRFEFKERMRPAYPGYLLVRRMFGSMPLGQIYELPHVGGLCCFGPRPAMISDADVEIIRMEEARGIFDQFDAVASSSHYMLSSHPGASKQLVGKSSRVLKRLAIDGGTCIFVEYLGRVTRVISSSSSELSAADAAA